MIYFASGEFGVYTNLDKTMVIQEARSFNESPLNYRKCNLILAKFLYLLYQSEAFTAKEATNIFFAVTKSFQCKDVRESDWVLIKEHLEWPASDDVSADQGDRAHRAGCDHGDEQPDAGHQLEGRGHCHVPRECDPSPRQSHRCTIHAGCLSVPH
jgi:hypothetical protein